MPDNLDRLDQEFQTWVAALPEDQRPPELDAFMDRLAKLVSPPMLPASEMFDLQVAAEKLSDLADEWQPYDPNRSSSGQEFITGPQSAGWYALIDGKPVEVQITYVTDELTLHDVRMELDLAYAMQHAPHGDIEDEFPFGR